MTSKWEKWLEENCFIPEAAGRVIATMNQEQVEVLMATVIHYIDTCFDGFAMHWETDATGFVRMLPEEERLTLLDASDDVETAFVDSLRKFAAEYQ
jgi:hypothetical protein